MRFLLLLSFFSGLFIPQKKQSGPDTYLNAKADFICQQIALNDNAIEDMYSRQAYLLTREKGLEPANESIRHWKKVTKQGINDYLYDGYRNLYLSQVCADYNRLFAVFDTKHLDNKLKRKRFIQLHNFMTNLMKAESIINIQNYVNDIHWDTVKNKLQPQLNNLQKLRWTASLKIVPEWRALNRFTIQLVDINDTNHLFEIDIFYNLDKDSKISELIISEYTKEHTKPETMYEEEEEVPSGK